MTVLLAAHRGWWFFTWGYGGGALTTNPLEVDICNDCCVYNRGLEAWLDL